MEEPPQRLRGLIGPFTARQIGVFNAVVVAVALGLLLITRPLEPSYVAPSFAPGATFYQIGTATQGLQVGQLVPDFVGTDNGQTVRLTDLTGRPIALSDFAGHPLWINFWATWCPPCQQETPDLNAAFQAHTQDGLVLLAIDIQEPADVVADYVKTYGLTYEVGLDVTAAIMRTFNVFGLPTHYFVDRDGVIRSVHYGPLTRAQIEVQLGPILAH
jgi:cytochrome c biogenesis protein CcmG/thiol:disulfide interchange protein DsbE